MNDWKYAITLAICCCTILTMATTASADYVGVTTVNKIDPDTVFLCNQGNGDSVPGSLTICNVFAEFDNPEDRLLNVGHADISTSDPLGYFQHAFGSVFGPACNLIPLYPDLICDSFATIGVKCDDDSDGTTADPDFDPDEFNNNGHVVGGWFNSSPNNGQGDAGSYPNLQVLFLQLSVSPGESSTGIVEVFARIDSEVVAFFDQTVECVAAAGCQDPEECEDGDPCTDDECLDEACVHTPIDCDDGIFCTEDSCDPGSGCVSIPNDALCDDGIPCTEDSCDPGSGCMNIPNDALCDDGNACTDDSCDPETGCVDTDIEQTLIVKQGACPAPVNPNSNGVIPMVLVGDGDFDVNNVNLASLDLHRCGDGPSGVQPLADHTKVKDLNHPGVSVGCGECQCNDDQSSDGIDDLSMKFRTDTTLAALGLVAGDSATLELSGTMLDGTPFCARDCIVVVPPGVGAINATMQSNVPDTFIEMTPLDVNVDSDGFADFTRAFFEGTTITLTAPSTSEGRRFLRWSVDGEMQGFGIRTVEVTISEDTTLKAFYVRPRRVVPKLPTEGSGDMD